MEEIQVLPCGLFVDKEHDFLAASPDGLVGGDNLIEVKCPKSAENLTISEAVIKVKSFCLEKLRCGNVRLKKNHNYYYQVQGQLHVAEKKICYFVVWTKKDIHIEKIERGVGFGPRRWRKKLIHFYHHALLPEILDPRTCRSMAIREPSIPFSHF
ncbi:uncharacterized protein LOC111052200 [Nilaparvata lugens]|uniref:uncharacterized protein LOC111052200 n=1 Tax=Nilaparvata lugens TaxID=108931 RepID=UPI00193CD500|nr:uncharacterized protein LOC111052200 [Nilaparvata lugens]